METVISKDGTPIAFDWFGPAPNGHTPVLILIVGALGIRKVPMFEDLAERVAAQGFTVINFDRRGRGDSGDTPPYAVQREIEDIEALIEYAGGKAALYGLSSGAALALEVGAALPSKVTKLALYEPPFVMDTSHPPLPADYVPHMQQLIAEGRRGDTVEYFMTEAVGVPAEYIAPMRADPMWGMMEAVAHTIWYDGLIMDDNMAGKPLSKTRWATATMPTLVMNGSESAPYMANGADALADVLPNAKRQTLQGQNHGVESHALVPVLVEFLAE